jgi:hypothetical protein
MTTVALPASERRTTDGTASRWRAAGVLGFAHLALMLGAFALEGAGADHHTTPEQLLRTYAGVSVGRLELTTYLEASAFLVLVPDLVLLGRLFASRTDGSSTEAGRVAAGSFVCLGVAYVASTLAIGFPPLLAGVYAAHHGVDAGTLSLVNDLRNYGFVLQVALSAAFALALGVAAVLHRLHTWWVGYGGIALGAIGLVATPFAHNGVSFFWLIWWAGLCVACLRGAPTPRARREAAKA